MQVNKVRRKKQHPLSQALLLRVECKCTPSHEIGCPLHLISGQAGEIQQNGGVISKRHDSVLNALQ